jgi:hypothetical protein
VRRRACGLIAYIINVCAHHHAIILARLGLGANLVIMVPDPDPWWPQKILFSLEPLTLRQELLYGAAPWTD